MTIHLQRNPTIQGQGEQCRPPFPLESASGIFPGWGPKI